MIKIFGMCAIWTSLNVNGQDIIASEFILHLASAIESSLFGGGDGQICFKIVLKALLQPCPAAVRVLMGRGSGYLDEWT